MDRKELKIPKARIGVLIGKDGEVKESIEKRMNVKIEIDSDEGDVFIEGEALNVFETLNVIKAIGRGFNPRIAELLYSEDNSLELIEIQDFVNKSKKDMTRIKGRVIGQEGRSRKYIEDFTSTHISVYGKTIAIIGEIERVAMAKHALEMLLEGAPHANVYKWLENKKRQLIKREFER